ncbi:MAG: Penicillin acylase like protein [Acidobacteria bacterium OLB17]|nr:MAG: Penicillin acylase like protein [Acidobacteria bacterium OLB17]MCZ2392042.1 penicillin acylase family protein [Acidobacteriota bacterium]
MLKHCISSSIAFLLLSLISLTAQTPQAVPATGLADSVTVRRDARGIPYIEAKNDADLYFAQGYVTATDRLWQMDMMRRVVRGETAELFGERTLEQDKRWRRFGFAKVVDDSFAMLSPELKAALESYARGVNAYIDGLTEETMPIEFAILQYKPEHWRPTDSLAIGKILADALSTTWRNDLLRAQVQVLPKEKLADLYNAETPYDVILFAKAKRQKRRGSAQASVPSASLLAAADRDAATRRASLETLGVYAEGLAASNNWVISGKRTVDGRPILANDPHLSASAPGIWYIAEIRSPEVHSAGVSIPGIPGIVLGHNDTIAWGATNVGPDVQDIYRLELDGKGKYLSPTGWKDLAVRKESIAVRTSLVSPATKTVEFDVTASDEGPVILDDKTGTYALRWTAFDPANNEFEAFYRLNRAKDWASFTNAVKTYGGPAQNFVYADTKGHIGWWAAGRIPIRRKGFGALPYEAKAKDGDWTGYIPFDELPHLYDPPSGLIVTANQRTVGTSYKYPQFSLDASSPWRARRIFDRLNVKRKLSKADVAAAQLDPFNIPLDLLAKEVVRRKAASAETLGVLKEWDGMMLPDSRGAILAEEIEKCLATEITRANPPATYGAIRVRIAERALRENLVRWLPRDAKTYDDVLRGCDKQARESLARVHGADPKGWVWGKVFTAVFPHPLVMAPAIGRRFITRTDPLAGSNQSPNVGSSVSMRFITSPGDWDDTRLVIPLGESGRAGDVHFKDQFDLWRTNTPPPLVFGREKVEKLPTTLILSPAGNRAPKGSLRE